MKIAVIGGGFSGLTAAYLLEKKGIQVTVFEREERLGGHCKTLNTQRSYTELGTVFSFSKHIKELLIELNIGYTERFSYKTFLNGSYDTEEHIPQIKIPLLLEELGRLYQLLDTYADFLDTPHYDYIPQALLMPLTEFLCHHNFQMIYPFLTPHLSSFGFGHGSEIQAFYVFKIFNRQVIETFMLGEKLLFIDKGTSALIKQLTRNISDIRYGLEVTQISKLNETVIIHTPYSEESYDKVLITTPIPTASINDPFCAKLMAQYITNPFVSAVYEVCQQQAVTTYFKSNAGLKNKIQFFYTAPQQDRSSLVAYAYGHLNKDIIQTMEHEIKTSGLKTNHLITASQWSMFPHVALNHLSPSFYQEVTALQSHYPICFIGGLITQPTLDALYYSVKESVEVIIQQPR